MDSRSKSSSLQILTHPTSDQSDAPVALEGWLVKRSRGVAAKVWHNRYFFLRGPTLSYYMDSKGGGAARGVFHLTSSCNVSDIFLREKKKPGRGSDAYLDNSSSSDSNHKLVANAAEVADHNQDQGCGSSSNNNSNLYCIEITWLKHTHSDSESSRTLISMDSSSLLTDKSASPSGVRFADSYSPTLALVPGRQITDTSFGFVEPFTTSADTDSSPPTPVTEHKSHRLPSSMAHSSNTPIKQPLIFSAFRRRKFLHKHSESMRHSHDSTLSTVSQTSISSKSLAKIKTRHAHQHGEKDGSPTGTQLSGLPHLPDLLSTSQDDASVKHSSDTDNNASSGPSRHYSRQLEELERKVQFRNDTRLKFQQLQLPS